MLVLATFFALAEPVASGPKAWPDPVSTSVECSETEQGRTFAIAREAYRLGNYARAASAGTTAGRQMRICYTTYRHPGFLLSEAELYLLAVRSSLEQDGDRTTALWNIANDDLEAVSSFSMPDAVQRRFDAALTLLVDTSEASAATEFPVQVVKTQVQFRDSFRYISIGVSFKNLGPEPAIAVKFEFDLQDAFGKSISTESGTMYGTFSKGVLIEPFIRRGDGSFQAQPNFPNSPAWEFYNSQGHDVVTVRATPVSLRFADGTIWERRKP